MRRNSISDRDEARRASFPDILNKEQAALYLGVSLTKLGTMLQLPGFPYKQVGDRYFFSRRALLAWIEDCENNSAVRVLDGCIAAATTVQYQ